GNASAHQVDVLLDSIAPTLSIQSPHAGQVFGSSALPVSVQIGDATSTTVTINGEVAALAAGGGLVTTDLTLAGEGANNITVSVVDAAGNTTSQSVGVVLDLTAPVVTTELADGIRLGPQPGNALPVTVHVDDTTPTTASFGGSSYALPSGGGVV